MDTEKEESSFLSDHQGAWTHRHDNLMPSIKKGWAVIDEDEMC